GEAGELPGKAGEQGWRAWWLRVLVSPASGTGQSCKGSDTKFPISIDLAPRIRSAWPLPVGRSPLHAPVLHRRARRRPPPFGTNPLGEHTVSFRQLIRHRGIVTTAPSAVAVMIAGGVLAAVGPISAHERMPPAANSQVAGSGRATGS